MTQPQPDPAGAPAAGQPAPPQPDPTPPGDGQGDASAPLGPEGQRALERMKAELAAAKAKIKEYEPLAQQAREAQQAQMTEVERERQAREAAEAQAREASTALLRYRIGAEAALPAFLVERLVGNTEEEMRADAVRVAQEWSGRTPPPPPPPPGAGDANKPGAAPGTTMNDLLRAAVRGG